MDENLQAIQEHLNAGEYTAGTPVYIEECESRDHAVEIETYFQDEKGMEKFNPRSRGINRSKYIYCYKMDDDNKNVILNEKRNLEVVRDKTKIRRTLREYIENNLNK